MTAVLPSDHVLAGVVPIGTITAAASLLPRYAVPALAVPGFGNGTAVGSLLASRAIRSRTSTPT